MFINFYVNLITHILNDFDTLFNENYLYGMNFKFY